MYNRYLKNGESSGLARFSGAIVCSFAIVVHLGLIYAILKKIYYSWFELHLQNVNKAQETIFVLAVFAFSQFYFRGPRVEEILLRFSSEKEPTRMSNYVKLVCLIFIPLAVVIKLSQAY